MVIKNRAISIRLSKWNFGSKKYNTVTQYYFAWILISIDNKEVK